MDRLDFTEEDWKWARENPAEFRAMLRARNRAQRAQNSGVNYRLQGARIGDLVQFNYMNASRASRDRNETPFNRAKKANENLHPTVLVLHNNWTCGKPKSKGLIELPHPRSDSRSRCFHGLNWDLLSFTDRKYLRGVMNPLYAAQLAETDRDFADRMKKVNAVSAVSILSPEAFYEKMIRPMIRANGWEPYRKYKIALIRNPRVVLSREVLAGAENETLYRQVMRRLDAMRGPNT